MKKLNVVFTTVFLTINLLAQNVGIGTTTPDYKLDVKGRMRLKTETLGNIFNTPGMWLEDYRDGSDRAFIGMQDSIRIGLFGGGNGGYGWGMNFNTKTANVNIGPTTDNIYKLQISGADYGFGLYDASNTFYGDLSTNAGNLAIGSKYGNSAGGSPAKHILLNPPASFFTFFPGNVGVNTNNPTHAKFEVNGRVGATVAMFGADAAGVSIAANNPEIGLNYFYNTGTKTIKAGYGANFGMSPSNGDIYIGNFNGNQSTTDFGPIAGYQYCMLIKQNGNVGIGTTDPTYKLSVNGNIRSKEVVVETGWADYVFDKQYKLPPLYEVEQYININNHLPDIPSAMEIQTNGLKLGELQTKMMQKIEELTLYIIEQNKRIEALEKKWATKN